MADNWSKGRLADFASIVMGTSPPGDTTNELAQGTPLLNGPTEFTGYSPVAVQYTTKPVKLCEPHDLLFCVRGSTTGRMNWADKEYAIGRGLAAIKHHKGNNFQPYVRAVIEHRLPQLLAVSTGSTFPSVSRADIENIAVDIAPPNEQLAIACILGALDDKIELNRRRNETLEAMARTIFKSWFVDFDPVRAKAAGQSPPGLSPELAALFPSSFTDSPLGEIPKGWQVDVLNSLSDFVLGGDWGIEAPSIDNPSVSYCIRGADIPSLQACGIGNMPVRYLKESSLQKRSLRDGDLVVEISGGSPTQSTGRPVLISHGLLESLEHPLTCSNFCRIFRPTDTGLSEYIYMLLRWLYDFETFLQYENGTTGIKNFAFSHFSDSHNLLLPSNEVATEFGRIIKPFFVQRQQLGRESRTLAALRDALLPKLITGELRVPDAERIVGRVL